MTAAKPQPTASRPFVKMHGLGNDFVVVDARAQAFALDDAQAKAIADRHTGVGCDQLIIMERPNGERIADKSLGPVPDHHPMFPERANIGVAQVLTRNRIRLRVWERGTGITLACGTGACAALVAAVRRDLTERKATVIVDGGELEIE